MAIELSDKEAEKLILTSIGLERVVEDLKYIHDAQEMDKLINKEYIILGKSYNSREIIKSSQSKFLAIPLLQELYDKIDSKCESITNRNLLDYLRD